MPFLISVGRLNQNKGAGENTSVDEIKENKTKIKYVNENQVNNTGVIKHGSETNKSKTKNSKQEDSMKLQIGEQTKEKNETNTNGYVQNKSAGKSVFKNENKQETHENKNTKNVEEEAKGKNTEIKNEIAIKFPTKSTYAEVTKKYKVKRFGWKKELKEVKDMSSKC